MFSWFSVLGTTRGQSATPKHHLKGNISFPLEGVQFFGTRSFGRYEKHHTGAQCLAAHTLKADVIFQNPLEGMKPFPLEGVQNFETRSSGKHEAHHTDVQNVRPCTLWRQLRSKAHPPHRHPVGLDGERPQYIV